MSKLLFFLIRTSRVYSIPTEIIFCYVFSEQNIKKIKHVPRHFFDRARTNCSNKLPHVTKIQFFLLFFIQTGYTKINRKEFENIYFLKTGPLRWNFSKLSSCWTNGAKLLETLFFAGAQFFWLPSIFFYYAETWNWYKLKTDTFYFKPVPAFFSSKFTTNRKGLSIFFQKSSTCHDFTILSCATNLFKKLPSNESFTLISLETFNVDPRFFSYLFPSMNVNALAQLIFFNFFLLIYKQYLFSQQTKTFLLWQHLKSDLVY